MKIKNRLAKTPLTRFQFRPEGSRKTFVVQVPVGIVRAFRQLDPDEEADIVESFGRCFANLNKEWQSAKSRPIEEGIRAELEFDPAFDLEPGPDFMSGLKKLERHLNDRKVKEAVLSLVRLTDYRTLNSARMKTLLTRAVVMAVGDNDHQFFKRFGRLLEKQAVRFNPPRDETPIEKLLLAHWITQDKRGPQLCCFTSGALNRFLKCVAPEAASTDHAVRKTVQRLRLRSTSKKLVRKVQCAGNIVSLSG